MNGEDIYEKINTGNCIFIFLKLVIKGRSLSESKILTSLDLDSSKANNHEK